MKGKFMSESDIYEKAQTVVKAWESMRPNKAFFRMTLDDFRNVIAPSGEAREGLADLETQTQKALTRRTQADRITRRAVIRIVNGVKGDPDEGEDGELLRAMGYLPHTARSSITSMARRNASRAAKAAVTEEDEE